MVDATDKIVGTLAGFALFVWMVVTPGSQNFVGGVSGVLLGWFCAGPYLAKCFR